MNTLVREQIRSILETWEFWVSCAAIIIIVFPWMLNYATMQQLIVAADGSFFPVVGGSQYGIFAGAFKSNDYIFPLACSLAVGASFAIDRKTRVAQYVLTRGFRKWQYLLAKAAAMMLCSMFLIAIVQGVTWIASVILARYPTVQPWEGILRVGARNDLLFHQIPQSYTIMIVFLRLLTAAAVATAPLLVAALGGDAWTSTITPIVTWFLIESISSQNQLSAISPGYRTYMLWWEPSLSQTAICPSLLWSSFSYWALLLVLNFSLATLVYLRQEDA